MLDAIERHASTGFLTRTDFDRRDRRGQSTYEQRPEVARARDRHRLRRADQQRRRQRRALQLPQHGRADGQHARGDDYVVLDDVLAATTINLGLGDDRVQVGQVFRSERVKDSGRQS